MRWFVFDFGEVIGLRPTTIADLARVVHAEPTAFEAAYWDLRHDYDCGMSDAAYWRDVAQRSGGVEPTGSDVETLTEADVAGWLETDPATIELIDDLSTGGYALALLSNAPVSFAAAFRSQPWAKNFEHLLVSGELGLAKPDAQIWTALLDRLGASAGDCLFLDDRQRNVEGALAAGLRAHRWTGASDAREVIADFLRG